jgi:hypothetical protein
MGDKSQSCQGRTMTDGKDSLGDDNYEVEMAGVPEHERGTHDYLMIGSVRMEKTFTPGL